MRKRKLSLDNSISSSVDIRGRRSVTPRDFDNRSVMSDYSTASTNTASSGSSESKRRKLEAVPGPNKNNEYKIENIVSIENYRAYPVFQVKWLGYPKSKNTWEPLEHVRDTEHLQAFLARESVKLKEYLDELVCEMTQDEVFTMPASADEFEKLLKTIEELDEILLQSDLLLLTLIKVYEKCRYPKTMYSRAKKNLVIKHFKDLRTDQLQKISEWSSMVNEKEPGSKIQVINDVDFDAPPADFVYVNSNVAGEGVTIPDTPMISCNCVDKCSSKSECCGKLMGSKFAYRSNGSLLIPVGNPIYECNSMCKCPPDCPNRVIQHGRKHKLNIFKTNDGRGWGVRTEKYIPEGQYICEYTGEIITFDEAEKRGLEYDSSGRTYLFDLDFYNVDNNYTIDALKYGNLARFINHSCDPNCGIWATWSDCQDPNLQKITFFSLRPIAQGEELTIDYLNGQIIDGNENDPNIDVRLDDGENVCPNNKTNSDETETNPITSENGSQTPKTLSNIIYEKFRPNSVINKETCVCKCGAPNCRKFIF